jgi:predicted phosphate transport protein (TIGR00153 family)
MSSLSDWFKSRNEESAINKTLIHMLKVLECVVEFEKGLTFLIEEKDIDLALKVFFRVNELEDQADGIRRNVLNMLSKADLPATIRENLMHLAKRIDDIANATNAGARILIYMNHADFLKLEGEVHLKILEMARISVDAVKKLNLMVNTLLKAKEAETYKLGEEVNSLEHKCDELRFGINRILVSNSFAINPFSAIEIHSFISALEAVSDNAEEVADYIIMLMVAKRT